MSIEEIKEKLFNAYDIDDEDDHSYECGAYLNGEWLSIKNIIEILER